MIIKVLLIIALTSVLLPLQALDNYSRQKLDRHFFAALNPDVLPEEYARKLAGKDKAGALKAAVKYFRNRPAPKSLQSLQSKKGNIQSARNAAKGLVSSIRIQHQFPDGKIDFLYNPTGKNGLAYNPEWQWQLNRMHFWGNMAVVYRQTGDEKLAGAFQQQFRNWFTNCPMPEKNWNTRGSAWRTIETGIRLMGNWQTAFELFRKSASISDETLALMLGSMHEQALHAFEHRTGQNWLMMELNGAYTFALFFPEFKQSAHLRKEISKLILSEMRKQVLPDGWQNELTPGYHSLVFSCGATFLKKAQNEGHSSEVPPELLDLLEDMADAHLAMMSPDFTQPLTNDSARGSSTGLFAEAYRLFPHRQDFLWASTKGRKGKAPAGKTASRFLPWGGFAVMRSNWKRNALYLSFDVGELGMAHYHQDKLNINIYKGKEELLYDDGGGQYEDSPFRKYAVSAKAHNTVLTDGMGQYRQRPQSIKKTMDAGFISTEKFDYARGVYNGFWGSKRKRIPKLASHTREVLFVKPDFFVVADSLQSLNGKPHDYTALWQLDTVKTDLSPGSFRGRLAGKYDLYALVLANDVQIQAESGKTDPVSGWYVTHKHAQIHPATTIKVTARRKKNYRFLTLFFPLKKGDAPPVAEKLADTLWQIKFNGKSCKLDLQDLRSNLNR